MGLRVALLSLMEAVAEGPEGLRGYLPIGGRAVVRHQLGLALALGCARVVVVTEALTGELVALQHLAEARGARFHVIAGQRALVPLVGPEDELFVFADGVLPMPDDVLPRLVGGPAVLALPVEPGLAAGFERIDINHASAGIMSLPGRLVSGLGDLPSDWNPVSALLRLAVQARVPLALLPDALLASGRWRLLRSEAEAQRCEPGWLRLHTGSARVRSPGEWLAALAVRRAGPVLLHAGTRPWVLAMAALALALLGLGCGWFGWSAPGFALVALSFAVLQAARLLAQIERTSLLAHSARIPADGVAEIGLDAVLVVLAAWRSEIPALPQVPAGIAWFAPLVLVLVQRLLPRALPDAPWTGWMKDRLVTAGLLALVSAALPFDLALRIGVLGLLAGALATGRTRPNPPLTNPG